MIQLESITVRAGSFGLEGINLLVPSGAYGVLMGASGQGKTTLLEAICGLKRVASGRVLLGGQEMTQWKPADRGVGYVPQDLALFPTMTVREHLEFPLRLRRIPRGVILDRVREMARLLEIEPLLDRRTRGLSGGESQRVALGRALSFRPRVLLLDEPLNAVDESTRDRLCELLWTVQRTTGVTTLHITHSRAEAALLADRMYLLRMGHIAELDVSECTEVGAESDAGRSSSPPPSDARRNAAGNVGP